MGETNDRCDKYGKVEQRGKRIYGTCAPSLKAFMTGKSSEFCGVHGGKFLQNTPEEVMTLGEYADSIGEGHLVHSADRDLPMVDSEEPAEVDNAD